MGDATLSTTSSTKSRTNLIYDHYFRHKRCWLLCLKLASLASFSDAWRPTVYPHRRSLSSSSCIICLFVFFFFSRLEFQPPCYSRFSLFSLFFTLVFGSGLNAELKIPAPEMPHLPLLQLSSIVTLVLASTFPPSLPISSGQNVNEFAIRHFFRRTFNGPTLVTHSIIVLYIQYCGWWLTWDLARQSRTSFEFVLGPNLICQKK